jgi:monoamine oxidase
MPALTRRHFLERLAATGGAALTHEAMTGLGLVARPLQHRFEPTGRVSGIRVIVLGAGLAGLTAAYELAKLGYRCQVLEARARPGGRVFTVRRGTVSEEDGPPEVCAFDEGLYYNPGAMRIPHHHATVLAYCRELNVPVEPFLNHSDGTFIYQTGAAGLNGRRLRRREVRTDLDGYVAELLAKAVSDEALDLPFTKQDRENLIDYLRDKGALDPKGQYRGSTRRGYDVEPRGPNEQGRRSAPLALGDLLASRAGSYLQVDYDYQDTMLQVVGGCDHLPRALAARLKDKVLYLAAAREIRQSEHGVTIVYDHDGRRRTIDGDYCICAMPLPLVAALEIDSSPEFKKAVASVPYASAGKIGLQFKRRFWEEDEGIYGGASRTDQDIAQIIYPSSGFHGRKGVLIGYYIQGPRARPTGERPPAERLELALEQGSRIHPQYRAEFETGFSVAWHRSVWNRGSWSAFSPEARRDAYPLLVQPQGRLYLAGDHVSSVNAWMQGAFESARHVVTEIHARAMRELNGFAAERR